MSGPKPRDRMCSKHGAYFGRYCRPCRREWKLANPPSAARRLELAAAQRARVAACRAYVREIKTGPCADCKRQYPWYVMEFDHISGHRGPGDDKVASLVTQGTLARVQREIAKCELVCANCHRIRTHMRAVERGERTS